MEEKKCSKCKKILPIENFNKDKYQKSGLRCSCKKCSAKTYNKWKKRTGRPKEYYKENKEKILTKNRIYRKENKEKIKEQKNEYRMKNENWYKKWRNDYYNHKYNTNICFRLRKRVSARLRNILKGKNNKSTIKILGYSIEELKKELSSKIPSGYSWNDYLSGDLHLDHIIPLSSYEFLSYEDNEFKKCWNLRNLRLICKKENLKKGKQMLMELINFHAIEDLLPEGF